MNNVSNPGSVSNISNEQMPLVGDPQENHHEPPGDQLIKALGWSGGVTFATGAIAAVAGVVYHFFGDDTIYVLPSLINQTAGVVASEAGGSVAVIGGLLGGIALVDWYCAKAAHDRIVDNTFEEPKPQVESSKLDNKRAESTTENISQVVLDSDTHSGIGLTSRDNDAQEPANTANTANTRASATTHKNTIVDSPDVEFTLSDPAFSVSSLDSSHGQGGPALQKDASINQGKWQNEVSEVEFTFTEPKPETAAKDHLNMKGEAPFQHPSSVTGAHKEIANECGSDSDSAASFSRSVSTSVSEDVIEPHSEVDEQLDRHLEQIGTVKKRTNIKKSLKILSELTSSSAQSEEEIASARKRSSENRKHDSKTEEPALKLAPTGRNKRRDTAPRERTRQRSRSSAEKKESSVKKDLSKVDHDQLLSTLNGYEHNSEHKETDLSNINTEQLMNALHSLGNG